MKTIDQIENPADAASQRSRNAGTRIMKEIMKARAETTAIFNDQVVAKGNMGALGRIYTSDARVLPPGAGMISGRVAIQQFWTDAIKAFGLKRVVLTTIDAIPTGEGVVEIGHADLKTASRDLNMKYVVFWKHEGGHWKWHVDIWNTNS